MVLINSSSSLQGCKLTLFLSYLTVYVFLLYLFFSVLQFIFYLFLRCYGNSLSLSLPPSVSVVHPHSLLSSPSLSSRWLDGCYRNRLI